MWGQWTSDTLHDNDTWMLHIDEDTPNVGRAYFILRRSKGTFVGHAFCMFEGDVVGSKGSLKVDRIVPQPTNAQGQLTATLLIRRGPPYLHVEWVGSWGEQGVLALFARDKVKWTRPTKTFKTWAGVKTWLGGLRRKPNLSAPTLIFRGQSDARWTLRTTFHRAGRRELLRYTFSDVERLRNAVSATTGRLFDTRDPTHFPSLLYLAQHHGFPTPLLDWSESPYIAAFFAYADLDLENLLGNVRIFVFDASGWVLRMTNTTDIHAPHPFFNVSTFTPLDNPRGLPQQSVVTTTNLSQPELWLEMAAKQYKTKFLTTIDLPRTLREEALDDLAYMGISAATMFPGLDGICRALREKYFRVKARSTISQPFGSLAAGDFGVPTIQHTTTDQAPEKDGRSEH